MNKLDTALKKELINNYRHNALTPCFLHGLINKMRFYFKKLDVIIRYTDDYNLNNLKTNKKKICLSSLNSYATRITPKKLKSLLKSDYVKFVYLDRKYKALLDIASPSLKAPYAWSSNITGKNITSAVVDTGIYPHDDLVKPVNRIIAFKDFVKNKSNPYDDNGHGTHVAGDIASNGYSSNGLYKAPAYESKLVGVKVLNKYGTGTLSRIIAGIEWCIKNKDLYNIRIMCLSLGAEAQSSYKEDLMCEAVENAWKAGIVVCAAAGNEGPESGTICSPGIDPMIITVGAAGDENTPDISNDTIASFSSRGPTKFDNLNKPDLVCPGVNIISLKSPKSYLDKISGGSNLNNYYISLSGTSMATPLCCGCVALLLQKYPKLTPDQVKSILTENADDIGYSRNAQGYGYVNVEKILQVTI